MSSSKEDMSQFAAEFYAVVAVSTRESSVQLSSRINELAADSRNQVNVYTTRRCFCGSIAMLSCNRSILSLSTSRNKTLHRC
jgi:hypothetical protein